MEQQVGPLLHGVLLECKKNSNETYDGYIQTTNGNNYYYFNHPVFLKPGNYSFNMATTQKENIDFEAVNIKFEKSKNNNFSKPILKSGEWRP
jgi:hypothetical protein